MVQFMYPSASCRLLICDVGGLTATTTPEYRQGAYEEKKNCVQKLGSYNLPLVTDVEVARGGCNLYMDCTAR
jgi:hypothetical protein